MQLKQFLTNRGTQLIMFGVDNPGRNWYNSLLTAERSWYTWSGHLGTQTDTMSCPQGATRTCPSNRLYTCILVTFAKLRRATVSLAMSVCPSYSGPTGGVFMKFYWVFSVICQENSSFIKIWQGHRVRYAKTHARVCVCIYIYICVCVFLLVSEWTPGP